VSGVRQQRKASAVESNRNLYQHEPERQNQRGDERRLRTVAMTVAVPVMTIMPVPVSRIVLRGAMPPMTMTASVRRVVTMLALAVTMAVRM
jgi:hypothetical protein